MARVVLAWVLLALVCRAAAAEEAGGVRVESANGYVSVTFAEKPSREVINALKASGYRWSGGSWHGQEPVPAIVEEEKHG